MCFNGDYSAFAQQAATSDTKPEVTLVVKPTELTVNKEDGRITFQVDAKASEGFTGTISGTLTVSQPINGTGIHLTQGSDSKTFKFTLAASQKTWETTPPQTGTFTVSTSPTNPAAGTVTYVVTVDPSNQFKAKDSPQMVRVTTVP